LALNSLLDWQNEDPAILAGVPFFFELESSFLKNQKPNSTFYFDTAFFSLRETGHPKLRLKTPFLELRPFLQTSSIRPSNISVAFGRNDAAPGAPRAAIAQRGKRLESGCACPPLHAANTFSQPGRSPCVCPDRNLERLIAIRPSGRISFFFAFLAIPS